MHQQTYPTETEIELISSLSERFLVLRSGGDPRMTHHYLDNDFKPLHHRRLLLHHNFNIIPENKHILV